MRRLNSVENDQVQLEVFECDCGFHIGLDFTYLAQEEDLKVPCPKCGEVFDTEELKPESYKTYTLKTVKKQVTVSLIDDEGVELKPFKVGVGDTIDTLLKSLHETGYTERIIA